MGDKLNRPEPMQGASDKARAAHRAEKPWFTRWLLRLLLMQIVFAIGLWLFADWLIGKTI